MAGCYAAIRPTPLVPQPEDTRSECRHSRGKADPLAFQTSAKFFLQNCSFGYFVGGWGKPPVDEVGRPLYGDVFGLEQQEVGHGVREEEEVDATLWGELESEEEEEEDEVSVEGGGVM